LIGKSYGDERRRTIMGKKVSKTKRLEGVTRRSVCIQGTTEIVFGRYPGHNETNLPPSEKMYLSENGRKELVFPVRNMRAFLAAENSGSCAGMFVGKGYKKLAKFVRAFMRISPASIPILRDDTQIVFNGFDNDGVDEKAGIYVCDWEVPRKDGIPHPGAWPHVRMPWSMEFTVDVLPNNEGVTADLLYTWFVRGGQSIGLGTYRAEYGKFDVVKWEAVDV